MVGALEIDLIHRVATWDGRDLGLIPRELELLVYLARHAGQPVTKGMLLEHVWGFTFDPRTSVVEMHLSRLRAKLERAGAADLVRDGPRRRLPPSACPREVLRAILNRNQVQGGGF